MSECGFCRKSETPPIQMFKCKHEFCENCIFLSTFRYIANIAINDDDFRDKFHCLTCNVDSKTSMEDFIYHSQQMKQLKKTRLCDSCNTKQLQVYCYVCKIYFCSECLDTRHNKIKKFRSHNLSEDLTYKERLNYCKCDGDRLVMFHCISCENNFCLNCTILFHFSHNLELLHSNSEDDSEHIGEADQGISKKRDSMIPMNEVFEDKANFEEIQERVSYLVKCNDRFSKENLECWELFYHDAKKSLKVFQELFIDKFYNKRDKIKDGLSNLLKTLDRIKLQHESVQALLEERTHPIFKFKITEQTALNKFRILVNQSYQFRNKLVTHEVASVKRSMTKVYNKRISLAGNKMVFKGEDIKNFSESATIIHSSKIFHEAYPNMLACVKGPEGDLYIAFINNQEFSIDFINISTIEKFKSLDANHIKDTKAKKILIKDNQRRKSKGFVEFGKETVFKSTKINNFSNGGNKISSRSQNKNLSIKNAHGTAILGLRHYKVHKDDILLTFSEDYTAKIWSCELMQCVSTIYHEKPVRSALIFKSNERSYIVLGSFIMDFPVCVNFLSGVFLKEIPIKGYTYHLDYYISQRKVTYLFVCTGQPYTLCVYDFHKSERLHLHRSNSYVHNIIVTPFEIPLVTFIDRSGIVSQVELESGKKIREVSGYGCYSVTKWNEKFYCFSGKELGFIIVDINDFSIFKEYKHAHDAQIKSILKHKHKKYGDILVTLGNDQKIKIFR